MEYKILVLGDAGVGKTCVISKLVDGHLPRELTHTTSLGISVKTVEVDGTELKLQLWDTAGQERFHAITNSYYRQARGIILVFDLTNEESFANIPKWMEKIQTHADEEVEMILVGNKCDMEDSREVSTDSGQALATSMSVSYFETSSMDNGTNIHNAVLSLARKIFTKKICSSQEDSRTESDFVLVQKSDVYRLLAEEYRGTNGGSLDYVYNHKKRKRAIFRKPQCCPH